jgi:hypothetical protein
MSNLIGSYSELEEPEDVVSGVPTTYEEAKRAVKEYVVRHTAEGIAGVDDDDEVTRLVLRGISVKVAFEQVAKPSMTHSKEHPMLKALMPTASGTVWQLLRDGGFELKDWETREDGTRMANPAVNSSKNSQWAFEENGKPRVFCVWHEELLVDGDDVVYLQNLQEFKQRNARVMADPTASASAKSKARGWHAKAAQFENLIGVCYRSGEPCRVIVLSGSRSALDDDLEREASRPDRRLLDEALWYVHLHDPLSGEIRAVRGKQRPHIQQTASPEDEAVLAELEVLLMAPQLSETEKAALAKVRIGQSKFRDRLLVRWGNACSVTGCQQAELLVASHIVPWSECSTGAERLSVDNGLLLTPHLDKLFELGLIGFDDQLKVVFGPKLNLATRLQLHVDDHMRLRKSFDGVRPFLARHRERHGLSS